MSIAETIAAARAAGKPQAVFDVEEVAALRARVAALEETLNWIRSDALDGIVALCDAALTGAPAPAPLAAGASCASAGP